MKFSANDVYLDVNEQSVDSLLKYASQVACNAGFAADASELEQSFLAREQ